MLYSFYCYIACLALWLYAWKHFYNYLFGIPAVQRSNNIFQICPYLGARIVEYPVNSGVSITFIAMVLAYTDRKSLNDRHFGFLIIILQIS